LNETTIAPEIGGLLIRSPYNALAPTTEKNFLPKERHSSMGHIAFGIANFDLDKVQEALLKRGLNASIDTGAIASSPPAEHDIHTSTDKSFHTTTPKGYNLRISNHTKVESIIIWMIRWAGIKNSSLLKSPGWREFLGPSQHPGYSQFSRSRNE
jgi:hypothetical protein